MHYFDSDAIIHCIVLQDADKQKESRALVQQAISTNRFLISPLVIAEVSYGLARIEPKIDDIRSVLSYWLQYVQTLIEPAIMPRAFELAEQIGFKHINDCIHTAIAESYNCERLYTYNESDFKRIKKLTTLPIVILKG